MRVNFPQVNIRSKAFQKQKHAVQNPVNFTAQCSEQAFRLKDIPNLHCPVCGLVMLNAEQRKTFVDDVAPKTGEALIGALTKYEDETALVGNSPLNEHKTIYRPLKAKIIEIIKQTARQNPNLNLLQIVQLKRDEFLAPLIKQQLEITFELEEYLETVELSDVERKTIKGIIAEYKAQILGESEIEFKRKEYIHALSNVTNNPEIQAKINEIMERLPQSNNDVNSFFVKYSKEAKSSREIASKFVDQSIPTAEHLKPRSKGGKNNTNNYICDCAECNSRRCNIDFNVWLEQIPEFAQNLQKYVNQIQAIIDEGNFPPHYDNYVDEIIKTIKKLSYSKLKLKVPKSNNPRKQDAIYQKRAAELEKIKEVMRNLGRRKNEIEEKIRALEENSQFYNIIQLELVKKQIENAERRILALSKDLSTQQQIRKEAADILDEITLLQIHLVQGDESAREKIVELDEKRNRVKANEAEARIKTIQSNIDTLKNNLSKLRKKEQQLTKHVVSETEVDDKIKEIATVLSEYNSINYQIGVLEEEIFDEKIITDYLSRLKKDMVEIRLQNIYLKQQNPNIHQQREDYETYLSKLELFEAGDDLMEFYEQQSPKLPKQTAKLIEIAQESLRSEIEELMKKDSVQYFTNIDRLKEYKKEREDLEERLAEINLIKEQIEALKRQAVAVLKGASFEELNEELEQLTRTKQTVSDIKHISELRTELEIIEDTISYNENILKQLRNFKNMSNEQFQDLINMIFY